MTRSYSDVIYRLGCYIFFCPQAYLSKNAVAVVEWGSLAGVLGTFQKLLSTRANEAYAFQLLGTIVVNVSVYVYARAHCCRCCCCG